MERMEKELEKSVGEIIIDLQREIRELEEENKKLNTITENTKIEQEADRKHIEELEEENKTLNEKVRFLEECLDRKEKLNEKYRKELKNYVYDAKQVRDIC